MINSPTFYNPTTKYTFLQRIVVPAPAPTSMQTQNNRQIKKPSGNAKLARSCAAFAPTTLKQKINPKTLVVKEVSEDLLTAVTTEKFCTGEFGISFGMMVSRQK